MERQNITLALPRDLLKKAKAAAALQGKSLSELLRETLEKGVREEAGFNAAKRRQLALLKQGFDFGTKGSFGVARDDLHERQ